MVRHTVNLLKPYDTLALCETLTKIHVIVQVTSPILSFSKLF